MAGILNRKLETTDDFDDDAMYLEDTTRDNRRTSSLSSKLSQIVPAKKKMLKVYSFSSRSFFLASQVHYAIYNVGFCSSSFVVGENL